VSLQRLCLDLLPPSVRAKTNIVTELARCDTALVNQCRSVAGLSYNRLPWVQRQRVICSESIDNCGVWSDAVTARPDVWLVLYPSARRRTRHDFEHARNSWRQRSTAERMAGGGRREADGPAMNPFWPWADAVESTVIVLVGYRFLARPRVSHGVSTSQLIAIGNGQTALHEHLTSWTCCTAKHLLALR